MRRGRRPGGAKLVDALGGSDLARARLQAILRTLSGEISVPEACQGLGIGEAMFHRMRSEYLQASLDFLEPKTPGRKPVTEAPEAVRIRQLEAEMERMKLQLYGAQVREELARTLPQLSPGAPVLKKRNRQA